MESSAQSYMMGWKSFGFFAVIATTLLIYFEHQKNKKLQRVAPLQQIGKPLIGGPWILIDHNGQIVSDKTWEGKYKLMYFGFTNCPDVCPAELSRMTNALVMLEKRGLGEKLVPLFVSVDPFRDTVERVRAYIKDFHPKLIGLTGTPQLVNACARSFRVYNTSSQHDENDTDYLVDHSVFVYMMDETNQLLAFYNRELSASDLADAIESDIVRHETGEEHVSIWGHIKEFFTGESK